MTWSFFAQCSRVQQLPAPYKRLINDVNKPTNRPTNNRRIETDQWLLTNSTRVFQPITSRLNRPITFNRPDFITSSTDNYSSLDSEDDYRTGSRNVSHQQQFFSELHSPGRSHYTNYWYSWVQTIYFNSNFLMHKRSAGCKRAGFPFFTLKTWRLPSFYKLSGQWEWMGLIMTMSLMQISSKGKK